MEESLPPGFRFHPTDEELITSYLVHKVSDVSFTSKAIAVVDLNKCEPWDLPGKASMGEKEWYFFNLKDRKYPTGLRTNRATEAGYWKTTGKDREICRGGSSSVLVGMKKTLVFYKGRAPRGEKSNWVMHEYRLENYHPFKPTKEEWVVCRVFQKSTAVKKPQQTQSSLPSLESPCDTNSMANEFTGDIENLPNLNTISNSCSDYSNNNMSATRNDFNGDSNNNLNLINPNGLNMNRNAATDHMATTFPSLTCPNPSFLSSNLSMNSLLLKALQLRSFQQMDSTTTLNTSNSYSYNIPQGDNISPFGLSTDHMSSSFQASSTKTLESAPQVEAPADQPLHLDSIW